MFGSTQSFGYGETATQPEQKKARQEEKQTCTPVTVRIIQDAAAKHAESQELLIHGMEASTVNLVGVVEALVEQATVLEFQINDATGRIKVRHYSSGSSLKVPGLENGKYVSVVGNLRTTPSAHVSAMTLRPVTNADEISYHMIEVAHAALRARMPSKVVGLGLSPVMTSPVKPVASTPAAVTPSAPQTSAKTAAPVGLSKDAILNILREIQESGNEEGISIGDLSSRLGQAADKVRALLTPMVDDGDVFTTTDDDHFAML